MKTFLKVLAVGTAVVGSFFLGKTAEKKGWLKKDESEEESSSEEKTEENKD